MATTGRYATGGNVVVHLQQTLLHEGLTEGHWCDRCLLPSEAHAPVVLHFGAAAVSMGTACLCRDCGASRWL